MRKLLLVILLLLCSFVTGAQHSAAAMQQLPANPAVTAADPTIEPGAWTMVVIPDTQGYVDHRANVPVLQEIVDWLLAQRDHLNIQLVLQEGDLVYQNHILLASQSSGDQNSRAQWQNLAGAFHRLDGQIPYIVVPGNHDYGTTCAENRSTHFNDYFGLQDMQSSGALSVFDAVLLGPNAFGEQTLENAAYAFTAPDGRQLLLFGLEWGPRQAVVDWADAIASRPEYRNHTKVLLTHAYLYYDGTRYDWAEKGADQTHNPHAYSGTNSDTNDGEELWNELVCRHPGFQMVLCGHVAGDAVDYLVSRNDYDQEVHQMVFNAQWEKRGGNGWIRLLEFAPDGSSVHVRTYSPFFAQDADPSTIPWRVDAANQFSFKLD